MADNPSAMNLMDAIITCKAIIDKSVGQLQITLDKIEKQIKDIGSLSINIKIAQVPTRVATSIEMVAYSVNNLAIATKKLNALRTPKIDLSGIDVSPEKLAKIRNSITAVNEFLTLTQGAKAVNLKVNLKNIDDKTITLIDNMIVSLKNFDTVISSLSSKNVDIGSMFSSITQATNAMTQFNAAQQATLAAQAKAKNSSISDDFARAETSALALKNRIALQNAELKTNKILRGEILTLLNQEISKMETLLAQNTNLKERQKQAADRHLTYMKGQQAGFIAIDKEQNKVKGTFASILGYLGQQGFSMASMIAQQAVYASVWTAIYGTINMINRSIREGIQMYGELEKGISRAMRTGLTPAQVQGAFSGTTMMDVNKIREIAGLQSLMFTSEHTNNIKDYMEAMYQLTSANISMNNALQFTDTSMKLAIAAEGDITQTTRTLAGLYNIFGSSIKGVTTEHEKFAQIANTVVYVWGKEQIELSQMNASLKYSAAVAKSIGMDYRELITVLGFLHTNMLIGSTAGTGFRQLLNSMAKDVGALRNAFMDNNDVMAKMNPMFKDAFDRNKPLDFMKIIGALREQMVSARKENGDYGQSLIFTATEFDKAMKKFSLRGSSPFLTMINKYDELAEKIKTVKVLNADYLDSFVKLQEVNMTDQWTMLLRNLKLIPAAFTLGLEGSKDMAVALHNINLSFKTVLLQAYAFGMSFRATWASMAVTLQTDVIPALFTINNSIQSIIGFIAGVYSALAPLNNALMVASDITTGLGNIFNFIMGSMATIFTGVATFFFDLYYGTQNFSSALKSAIAGIGMVWKGFIDRSSFLWKDFLFRIGQGGEAKPTVAPIQQLDPAVEQSINAVSKAFEQAGEDTTTFADGMEALDFSSKKLGDNIDKLISKLEDEGAALLKQGNIIAYVTNSMQGFEAIYSALWKSYSSNSQTATDKAIENLNKLDTEWSNLVQKQQAESIKQTEEITERNKTQNIIAELSRRYEEKIKIAEAEMGSMKSLYATDIQNFKNAYLQQKSVTSGGDLYKQRMANLEEIQRVQKQINELEAKRSNPNNVSGTNVAYYTQFGDKIEKLKTLMKELTEKEWKLIIETNESSRNLDKLNDRFSKLPEAVRNYISAFIQSDKMNNFTISANKIGEAIDALEVKKAQIAVFDPLGVKGGVLDRINQDEDKLRKNLNNLIVEVRKLGGDAYQALVDGLNQGTIDASKSPELIGDKFIQGAKNSINELNKIYADMQGKMGFSADGKDNQLAKLKAKHADEVEEYTQFYVDIATKKAEFEADYTQKQSEGGILISKADYKATLAGYEALMNGYGEGLKSLTAKQGKELQDKKDQLSATEKRKLEESLKSQMAIREKYNKLMLGAENKTISNIISKYQDFLNEFEATEKQKADIAKKMAEEIKDAQIKAAQDSADKLMALRDDLEKDARQRQDKEFKAGLAAAENQIKAEYLAKMEATQSIEGKAKLKTEMDDKLKQAKAQFEVDYAKNQLEQGSGVNTTSPEELSKMQSKISSAKTELKNELAKPTYKGALKGDLQSEYLKTHTRFQDPDKIKALTEKITTQENLYNDALNRNTEALVKNTEMTSTYLDANISSQTTPMTNTEKKAVNQYKYNLNQEVKATTQSDLNKLKNSKNKSDKSKKNTYLINGGYGINGGMSSYGEMGMPNLVPNIPDFSGLTGTNAGMNMGGATNLNITINGSDYQGRVSPFMKGAVDNLIGVFNKEARSMGLAM